MGRTVGSVCGALTRCLRRVGSGPQRCRVVTQPRCALPTPDHCRIVGASRGSGEAANEIGLEVAEVEALCDELVAAGMIERVREQ